MSRALALRVVGFVVALVFGSGLAAVVASRDG